MSLKPDKGKYIFIFYLSGNYVNRKGKENHLLIRKSFQIIKKKNCTYGGDTFHLVKNFMSPTTMDCIIPQPLERWNSCGITLKRSFNRGK